MILSEVNDLYDDLTVRSKNIILHIGGIEEGFKYYIDNKNFYAFRNVGRVSNDELIEFYQMLSSKKYFFEDNYCDLGLFNIDNVSLLFDYYLNLKKSLNLRLIYALNNLEISFNIKDSALDKCNYLNQLLKSKDKIINFKGLGRGAGKKFDEIISNLTSYNNKLIESKIILDKMPKANIILLDCLGLKYLIEFENLIKNNLIDLYKLSFVLIRLSLKNHSAIDSFDNLFQNKDDISHLEIAKKINLTRERIRQFDKRFSNVLIPSSVLKLRHKIDKSLILNYDTLLIS